MPKLLPLPTPLPTPTRPRPTPPPPMVPMGFKDHMAFSLGFRRLRKGNLWRVLAEQTVTVFAHDDGTFGWSIAGPGRGRPRYSAGGYVTEAAAMEALAAELGQR